METQTATRLTNRRRPDSSRDHPLQFFDRFQIDASLQPEKRLMLAVLEDAVGTFQKYGVSSRQTAAARGRGAVRRACK